MLVSLLSTKYSHLISEGWGAFEMGNYDRAEEHFRDVLKNEDDPKIGLLDLVEAHGGLGAVNFEHRDFFEATRWYNEAKYLLDRHYDGVWPKKLDWSRKEDRPAMRVLTGLGHLYYRSGNLQKAEESYKQLIHADKHDGLGIKTYLEALKEGKKFEEIV